MRIHVGGIGLAVVTLAAIGCNENSQQLPPGPRMQATAPTASSLACDFKALNNLATHYFGSAEAKVVRSLISQMQTATAFTTAAQDRGFDVMAHIASNIKRNNTDVADASNLTNGLLVCMYDPSDVVPPGLAALPDSFSHGSVEDFSIAVNPTDSGAYDVRGGTSDLTDAVLSRPVGGSFSGVAPCASGICTTGDSTWPGILSSNQAPKRVLVYGEPGGPLQPNVYEWHVVPRNASFSPPAIVGFCIPASAAKTSLIHENDALLPFVEQDFVPACTVGLSMQSWSSQFASRLARWGMDLFGPRPLSATIFMNPGGLAGSTGGIHSEFGPQVVQSVTLTFRTPPHDASVNQDFGPVVVTVTAAGTATPVPNVTVKLSAVNNNGSPALVTGDTLPKTTDATGQLTFEPLYQSKTGGYTIVVSGAVGGRAGIAVPAVSARINIRP